MQCNAMQCNTNGAVSCINSLPVLGSPNQCAALKCASSSLSFLPLSGSSKKEACNALNIRQARLPGQKGEVATSCTWAPCLVDTVSSGRTGPWQDRGCRGEGHVLRVLHTVEAFYSEHHWEQGVCDLRVITHRQPHTSLFLILSETLSGQTPYPVPILLDQNFHYRAFF